MNADPITLMAALVLMLLLSSLSWAAMATALGDAVRVSRCMALANGLVAISLATHALRGQAPDLLTHWGSDLCSLAGLALLRASIPALSNRALAWRSGLAVWLIAGLALGVMPYEGDLRWHSRVVFSALALLALLAALDAWRQLRERLKPGMATLLSSPFFLIALLLATRVVESLFMSEQLNDLRNANLLNLSFLWSSLLMNLLLNTTVAFLVLMSLILRIQQLTRLDPLTQTLNRRALQEAIDTEHLRLQRGKPYALVMMDMDHFKKLNDGLGHAAGDAALLQTVAILKQSMRDVDALGRIGGEEFCVLLPLTGLAGAALVAERMRRMVEECDFQWQGKPWPLSASFGIAEALPSDISAETVLQRADLGLYWAKAQGRNLVLARES
ncbi:GGDEF domain-containing protein [Paucibacter sp. KCTC 42545]|uniref:GGDEF domain-containing protein n=1 Tax=Paucibacter sp. KCTC 42545 TaxID=1768242 RepID=UPI000733BCBD|nr:GGDEF domain-containing protein [Paucibacter sp. KCTC 42545]ALT79118.1 hypothetical protein AT984_19915 [Paucibacter sp. KCTC 42545]